VECQQLPVGKLDRKTARAEIRAAFDKATTDERRVGAVMDRYRRLFGFERR